MSDQNGANEVEMPIGWTKEEKYDLLQALKLCGSQNVDQLQEYFPNKSLQDVQDMVNFYKKKATNHPIVTERRKKVNKVVDSFHRSPLGAWAEILHESFESKDLRTETATALRMIADLENIPPPVCTGNVDFRVVYHVIANAMEGKSIPDNVLLNSVLEKCIIETAYTSKVFIRKSALRDILDTVNFAEKDIGVFPRPTDNQELATLRHLYAQRNYNPLKIDEEFLKGSMHKKQ